MTEHAFLTAQEVADYLRTTLHTVRVMIKDGQLKGAKVGREYRISKRSFDAYLDSIEGTHEPLTE